MTPGHGNLGGLQCERSRAIRPRRDALGMRAGSNGQRPSEEEKNRPMAATLQEILLAPATRPQVIADCNALIEHEVSEKPGISGTAVKLAYKTASTFAPGHVRQMVGTLLQGMADQLHPF